MEKKHKGSIDLEIKIENIDKDIFSLCKTFNNINSVKTRASCEGHWSSPIGTYILFSSDTSFASKIDKFFKETSSLNYYWELVGYFDSDSKLWYRISPSEPNFTKNDYYNISTFIYRHLYFPFFQKLWFKDYVKKRNEDFLTLEEFIKIHL